MHNKNKKQSGRRPDNRVIQLGNLFESKRNNPQVGRVYSVKGIAPCLSTMQGGSRQPFIVECREYYIAASRGRDPDNPSRRTAGGKFEQRLELNRISNTLTTVDKDNYVLEKVEFL